MCSSSVFSKMYSKMTKHLGLREEDEPALDASCVYCTRTVRMVDFDDLQPGDHISMGGKHGMFNFLGRQVSFYKHHAIVKHVEKVNSKTTGIVTFIHFYSLSFDGAIQIRETKELLDLGNDEIYKVKYCHRTRSVEEIIERAEFWINNKTSYSGMLCNCEHFCHWCCIGTYESYQMCDLLDILRQIGTGMLDIGGPIGPIISGILMASLDDIAKAGRRDADFIGVPWRILSVYVLVYFIYCLYRHHCLNRDNSRGLGCSGCCSKQKIDMWLKFSVFCLRQPGGFGLMSLIESVTTSKGIVYGCIAASSVISIALINGISKLKNALASPFKGQMVKVRTTENICIGDAISFHYKVMMHNGIVSKVTKITQKRAKVSVIHYSRPCVLGRRVVREETLDVDLTTDVIKRHDYSGYTCHPPEIVVQRARQRLGEKKHSMFSNRSCHFCYWAKLNEDVDDAPKECPRPAPQLKFDRSLKMGEDISAIKQVNVDHRTSRKHATKTMGSYLARIPKEVKEGSVITFKYGSLPLLRHFAVTTEVEYPEDPSSLLAVRVVHYGKGSRPCEEKFRFDLRRDDVWVYKCHPLYRYSRKDVIRRARARVGHGKYNVMNHRSSHLAEEIVRKDQDQLITNFEDVSPGDVIIFYYWCLKHAAIVVNIGESSPKANGMANVTIIHYALDGLFRTRTIKQETVQMDLSRDHVYRRHYGEVTYPPDRVVSRAKSRLNEQRFHMISNKSWHLVHWAKVVQTPAIVHTFFEEETSKTPDHGEKIALLPLVGKVHDRHFQRVPVHAWRDLQPGIIIEYTYYWLPHEAILVDVDYKAKKITVIHYGTDTIFSTRTIMKDTFRIDLRQKQLWIYRCDPTVCNPPELSVALAYERLGEQKWNRNTNRSWHFCKDCVLKKRSKSSERN